MKDTTKLFISLTDAVDPLARITLIVARSSGAALRPNNGLKSTELIIMLSEIIL